MLFALLAFGAPALAASARLKDLGRFAGWRENPVVGYGIVTGLAGSGDSSRSQVTRQALRNVLARMGTTVDPDQINSRNVAVVMVTATLPPTANLGDRIDITVTSIGDARSLAGGTLLLTPLLGPDQRAYAVAQGQLVVGGYRFDADQNLQQKNYPTVGRVPEGATIETAISADLQSSGRDLVFLLRNPDFSTAENVAAGINSVFGRQLAHVRSADAVVISTTNWSESLNALLARVESITVETDRTARIVINERSGTVVAGGDVRISDVVIAQGDIKVAVSIDNTASQPNIYGGYVRDARGLIVTNTKLDVRENADAVLRFASASVADLIVGLSRAKVKTRDMISILQAMRSAGALNAEIIVQ